jgi:3-phenylpropionate/cinnamic acid dioxygenase small subunit
VISVQDRLEITELYARNAWAFDTGDVEAFVATFAEDAILDLASRHEGHPKIRRLVQDAARYDPWLPYSQHIVSDVLIEPEADQRVRVRAYVTRIHRLPGRSRNNCQVVWAGYEEDVVTRASGRWLFAHKAARAWQGTVVGRITRPPVRTGGMQ